MSVPDLVEAVVLSRAEDLLDVVVRRGWEGRWRGSVPVLTTELVAGEVGGVEVTRVGPGPGQ